MKLYSFEKMRAWQESKKLVSEIYKLTNKFPSEEKFGLTSQIKRASISICSNLAEGSNRIGKNDQARFYEISNGSLLELLSQLIIAHELNIIQEEELKLFRNRIEMISRLINSLRISTMKRVN